MGRTTDRGKIQYLIGDENDKRERAKRIKWRSFN